MRIYHSLYPEYRGYHYCFNEIFGVTYKRKNRTIQTIKSEKLHKELSIVINPYLAEKSKRPVNKDLNISILMKLYAYVLIWLYKHFYPGIWLLSHINLNVFDDAVDACDAFYKIHPKNQQILCLPRSVFAATTSKKFHDFGIMIIGGFLPSRHMHAWIMEDAKNAWRGDSMWINFTPISVML